MENAKPELLNRSEISLILDGSASNLTDSLRVLLEPSGWFLFWESLIQVLFESQKIKHELHFYSKRSTSKIKF